MSISIPPKPAPVPTHAQLSVKFDALLVQQEASVRQIDALAAQLAELIDALAAVSLERHSSRVSLTRKQAEDAGYVINIGPKGGVYYMSASNNKVYVKRNM